MIQALEDVTRAMQTATAPVFLILGSGTLLGAMSARYTRVLDLGRLLLAQPQVQWFELDSLRRRARRLRLTIILVVASVSVIVLTIFVIFATILMQLEVPYIVPGLFGLSLLLLIASLLCFIGDFAISLQAFDRAVAARRRAAAGETHA